MFSFHPFPQQTSSFVQHASTNSDKQETTVMMTTPPMRRSYAKQRTLKFLTDRYWSLEMKFHSHVLLYTPYISLTLEGLCIIFCDIYTFQRDTQCSSTECLLMHRCQLYMFRTVTVHPQEPLIDTVCADYGMS